MNQKLLTFTNAFKKFDETSDIEILDAKLLDFFIEISVKNAMPTANTKKILEKFFGNIPVVVEPVRGQQKTIVKVSRVQMPSQGYDFFNILKFIEANSNKGVFLGISSLRPEYFNWEDFKHGLVTGTTGFGKSVFFKFMLAQTLALHDDIVNHIIDPKGVDFKCFNKHSNVGIIANSNEEWKDLFTSILIELNYRKHIFSSSFTTPPVKLDEYKSLKEKYKADDLPDFKRIIIWIDEAEQVLKDEFSYGSADDVSNMLSEILRRGRAFGIHVFLSTQTLTDVLKNGIADNLPTRMQFNQERYRNSLIDCFDDNAYLNVAIPGRINVKVCDKLIHAQTPFTSSEDALAFALSKNNRDKVSNLGFSRLVLDKSLLNKFKFKESLLIGKSFDQLINPENINSDRRDKDSDFLYQDLYEDLKTAESEKESVVSDDNKTKKDRDSDFLAKLLGSDENDTKVQVADKHRVKANPYYDNSLNYEEIIELYQHKLSASESTMNWVYADLSKNCALKSILNHNQGLAHGLNNTISLAKVGLINTKRKKLNAYIEDVRNAIEFNRKSPLLIVTGEKGLGKKTIVNAVMNEINIQVRNSNSEDISNILVDDGYSELLIEVSDKEKTIEVKDEDSENQGIIFRNSETAIDFNRHGPNSAITVLLLDVSKYSDYRYISEPHCHIHVEENDYLQSEVFSLLIEQILSEHNFQDLNSIPNLSCWGRSGVKIRPTILRSIVKRAARQAQYENKDFSKNYLENFLEQLKVDNNVKNEYIEIITPKKTLGDLMTQDSVNLKLHQIINKLKNGDQNKFKFIQNLRVGERLIALFDGPPGTGKSMAAEVVAFETNSPLWYCDIGKLQNAYVGETEKIFTDVFNSAQAAKAILLLDECDAFLASRESQQSDYSKKWSNHLLNLMEKFQGYLILTTNFANNLDSAISRRCDVKITFKSPDKNTQMDILKRMLQPDAPVEPCLDYSELLEDINLTGGLIRNAVERAVMKMQYQGDSILRTNVLRQSLLEIYYENQIVVEERKKIGIGNAS